MLKPAKTLVLAPHPDDAAFSVGGHILGRHLPAPITIVTLFGRSNYARGHFQTDAVSVTALRRAEDEAWARDANAGLVWLNAPEAALRVGSTFQAVFGHADHEHEAVNSAAENLASYIEEVSPRLIVSPLGIGGHCDHVVTCEMAKEIARKNNIPIAFYEELPYAFEASEDEIVSAAARALSDPLRTIKKLRPGELDAKCSSLSRYESQIDESVINAVRGHGLALNDVNGGECFWVEANYSGMDVVFS